MKNKNPGLGLCLAVLAFSAAAETPVPSAGMVTVDIKSQPVGSALNELAQQAGMQVIFYSDVADGIRAPAVAGTVTPDAALKQLLSNTGLTYEYVNSRTVAVQAEHGNSTSKIPGEAADRPQLRLASLQIAQSSDTGPTQDTADARARAGSAQKRRIEEVIVTATKRAESVQDVPISVAVVTADDIDRRGLVNSEDYLRGIPGVMQTDNEGFGQSIIIRGIETSASLQNSGAGATTATYFGETPTTRSAGINGGSSVDIKLVDIERVEVLRGPQGTAFGNSSMGGAVRTIPVAPKLDRFEAKLAAGYSVTSDTGGDNYNVQAVANLPLARDKFAIRATGYQYEDSGFYRNRAGSDPAFRQSVVSRYGVDAFAVDQEEVGAYYVLGGRVAALFQASDALKFTLSYLTQKTESDGSATANSGLYEQTVLQVAPEHVLRGEKGGVSDTDIDLANLVAEYDFGWANLLATYSYLEGGTTYSYPYTIILPWPVSSLSVSDHRENVGEIRLVTQLDGAWNFLVGVYGEELDDVEDANFRWYGDPTTNIFIPSSLLSGDSHRRQDLKQKAAFGEVSWQFLPGFTLTGGVRAFDYSRTTEEVTSGGIFYRGRVTSTSRHAEASDSIFRGNLSYKIDDSALLYAGWSQGFRLGKPQPGLQPGVCDVDGNGVVDGTDITIESTRSTYSDTADSYELGGKFDLLDRRVSIAADVFRMEWSNIPAVVSVPCGGVNFPYTANVGSAVSEGVEFQMNLRFAEAFRVDVGGAWINARLKEVFQGIPAGAQLPGSPKVNANLGLQYDFDVGGLATSARIDSIYVGPFYGDLRESPLTKVDGYVKLDASARVSVNSFNIDLFVRNLTNEDAYTFRGAFPRVGYGGEDYGYRLRPRTIGLQIGYSF